MLSQVSHIFQESIFKLLNHTQAIGKTILKFVISFFKILFVLLEITHFKAPDGSENGKWIKIDLTSSSP
jgi:hypothetical protein